MTSNKPYLIRALYEWIADNHMTPYLLVDANRRGVVVPKAYINNGEVVLNIAFQVVHNLSMGNDAIRFDARFKGVSQHINAPIGAIKAIYAKETGKGMGFDSEDDDDDSGGGTPGGGLKGAASHLRIVK